MRLLLRPVMRSLIVPQYALECLKMPSGTIRENRTRWTQFAYFQSVNYSIFFLVKHIVQLLYAAYYQQVILVFKNPDSHRGSLMLAYCI